MAGKSKRTNAKGAQRSAGSRAPGAQSSAQSARKARFDLGKLARRTLLTLAILAIPALIIGMEVRQNQQREDLSAIGSGTPVAVQVHDPGCPECRSLLENVEAAHADFRDAIELRVVNIKGGTGAQFAREHNVGHVTLVLFDGAGEHYRTLAGVRSPDQLRGEFRALTRQSGG